MDCEVERLFKLSQDDIIPVSYEVPRKVRLRDHTYRSLCPGLDTAVVVGVDVCVKTPLQTHRTFAEDLFPLTVANVPALSAEEWLSGQTKRPNLMSLDPAKRGITHTHTHTPQQRSANSMRRTHH
jgi:hypothetical protein